MDSEVFLANKHGRGPVEPVKDGPVDEAVNCIPGMCAPEHCDLEKSSRFQGEEAKSLLSEPHHDRSRFDSDDPEPMPAQHSTPSASGPITEMIVVKVPSKASRDREEKAAMRRQRPVDFIEEPTRVHEVFHGFEADHNVRRMTFQKSNVRIKIADKELPPMATFSGMVDGLLGAVQANVITEGSKEFCPVPGS